MAKVPERRVRILGSLEASIVDVQYKRLGWSGRTLYTLQVSTAGSGEKPRYVERSYPCFARLHALLQPRHPELPSLPPRGVCRRAMLPAFRAERQRRLGEWLTAIVALDPAITDPNLSQFLGECKPSACFEVRADDKAPVSCREELNLSGSADDMYRRVRKWSFDTVEARQSFDEDLIFHLDTDDARGAGGEDLPDFNNESIFTCIEEPHHTRLVAV